MYLYKAQLVLAQHPQAQPVQRAALQQGSRLQQGRQVGHAVSREQGRQQVLLVLLAHASLCWGQVAWLGRSAGQAVAAAVRLLAQQHPSRRGLQGLPGL